MVDSPPQIYACLGVYGSFDPAELTALLGVSASVHRGGEPRRGGRVHDEDGWHFSTTKETSYEWPDHLDRVLEIVVPHTDEFVRYCDDRGLTREVHLIAEMSGETPVGSLTAAQLASMSALGCSLEVDLYCWPDEGE